MAWLAKPHVVNAACVLRPMFHKGRTHTPDVLLGMAGTAKRMSVFVIPIIVIESKAPIGTAVARSHGH